MLPRVPNALGEGKKHSRKPSPSATLGGEPPGMPLTGKRSSPSVKNRTLGKASPECHPSTRGIFDVVGAVRRFLKKSSSSSATLGEENYLFLIKILFPECCTRGRNSIFFNPLPRVLGMGTRGKVFPFF
jgi:hypothetical protein